MKNIQQAEEYLQENWQKLSFTKQIKKLTNRTNGIEKI